MAHVTNFLLPNYKILETRSLGALEAQYSDLTQPNRFFQASESFHVRLAQVGWSQGRITYSELCGKIINASVSPGKEVVVGVLGDGHAEVMHNLIPRSMKKGDVILYLPGDESVHLLDNTRIFSVRVPISHARLIRMRGRPFKSTEAIDRRVERSAALDVESLSRYLASEAERVHGLPSGADQIDSIGLALTERVLRIIDQHSSSQREVDPGMLEICRTCDFAIESTNQHYSAHELSEIACCSHRQLYRAFSLIADSTPMDYQRRVHLARARSFALRNADSSVSMQRLAEKFGFGSASQLRKAYVDEFGQTPADSVRHRREVVADMLRQAQTEQVMAAV